MELVLDMKKRRIKHSENENNGRKSFKRTQQNGLSADAYCGAYP